MKNLNKLALVSFIIGLLYLLYCFTYFFNANTSSSGTAAAGAALATSIVMPHMICVLIAVIFNGLGLFLNKRSFVLVGAIMYAVSMVLMPIYFMFVIIEMILSFIAYAKMKKLKSQA